MAAVAGVWLERIDTLRCLDLRRERDSMPSTSATLATSFLNSRGLKAPRLPSTVATNLRPFVTAPTALSSFSKISLTLSVSTPSLLHSLKAGNQLSLNLRGGMRRDE